jgi:hypothetical protein
MTCQDRSISDPPLHRAQHLTARRLLRHRYGRFHWRDG